MGDQLEVYKDCINKQLEEVNMLCSIYCTSGEIHILDPEVISEFNEFLQESAKENAIHILKSRLEYNIKLELPGAKCKTKLDVRIQLPHLYPTLENAIVTIHTHLLNKDKALYLKTEVEKFVNAIDKSEAYIFQVLSWMQEQIENLLEIDTIEFETKTQINPQQDVLVFERLWIYSHHIKSKTKRQEIVKQARSLNLSGFSRPGKPGIICVEGVKACTQEFWRLIKSMQWQKISVCKTESSHVHRGKFEKLRRFEGFKEQLFCNDMESDEGVMNMRLFLKYLDLHSSSYMKKELFGLE